MALRLCSSYRPLQFLNSMPYVFEQTDPYLTEDLSSYWGNSNPPYPIDSSSFSNDPDEYFYKEYSTHFSSSFPDLTYLSAPENFPAEDEQFDCYYHESHHAKRLRAMQACSALNCVPSMLLNSGENPFGNQLVSPEFSAVFASPNVLSVDSSARNLEVEAVALSPQSIAARQRRKRISEKTQELGRLIPGGAKMNTAEMLSAAAKYVKFLQAQVGILEILKHSVPAQEEEAGLSPTNEQLYDLLSSPIMQEKLYAEEKCILPLKSAKSLAENPNLRKSVSISKELRRMLQESGNSSNCST